MNLSWEIVAGYLVCLTLVFVAGVAFVYSSNMAARVGGVCLALSALIAIFGVGELSHNHGKLAGPLTAGFLVLSAAAFVYLRRPTWMQS